MAVKRRTEARRKLIEESVMDLKVILAYVAGDEDDLIHSMVDKELDEIAELAEMLAQAVKDEKEAREKPKSGHAGRRGPKGVARRSRKSTEVEV